MSLSPFDYTNAINMTKEDIMVDDLAEKAYAPYMVNRSLSYFMDTVLLANEMNTRHRTDHKLQFSFLLNSIRKGKRFSKWAKPMLPDDIEVVKEYYGYSNDKAKVALTLLSEEELKELRMRVYKGGTRKLRN